MKSRSCKAHRVSLAKMVKTALWVGTGLTVVTAKMAAMARTAKMVKMETTGFLLSAQRSTLTAL
jgi:hypothetical protein